MTPRRVVAELDRHIVGQLAAKKAVAVALRNRLRRRLLPGEMSEEVAPKNILLIGTTGVGKTEIARRLARLTGSPFLKVEASKFTEVGYVGRDVESMVRDITEIAVEMVRREEAEKVGERAEQAVEERLLDLLLPRPVPATGTDKEGPETTREKLRGLLRQGKLEDRQVRVSVQKPSPMLQGVGILGPGADSMQLNLQEMLGDLFQGGSREKTLPIREAREVLRREEEQRLVDMEKVTDEALRRVQETGIIFLDEIDKVAGRGRGAGAGPDVSREGVQRDLLPLVEGTTVTTRHGMVKTDHVLFIAAGAFHESKPSDLVPELQGRFPIRVEMESLGRAEFIRILREPQNALPIQYTALLATEGVTLEFPDDAIEALADCAVRVNEATEDIGARRLHTVVEKVVESISFEAPERTGETIVIDAKYVHTALEDLVRDEDLSRYIL
jgi:ATP-dependent HslUV protease ATP-binding subunit HslU